MKTQIILPDAITSKNAYKRKFGFLEMYRAFVYATRALLQLITNNKSQVVDKKLIERIHLAITEVNGCAACSYQHTKMALRKGMSNEEIHSFLSGENKFILQDEAKAIVFAQHFADSRGFPKKYAYDAIVNEYGEDKANIILAASQVMIAGNIYGLPLSAFLSRYRGKTYKESSLFYELGMLIGGLIILPIAIFHGLLRGLIGLLNTRLDESTSIE